HLEEEQIGDLLDVVAVVDPVVAERVAEPPEFLDDVDVTHAAIASFSSPIRASSWPPNARRAARKPPLCSKIGMASKSEASMERLTWRCWAIRLSHCCWAGLNCLPAVTFTRARSTRSVAVRSGA